MKIYVASSWRNKAHPNIVDTLRAIGHEVYDFKRDKGARFNWSEIGSKWEDWIFEEYLRGLSHERAQEGFASDFDHMKWADVFVLVLPSGASSHLEAGWAIGQGKPTCICWPEGRNEPELMYKLADRIVNNMEDLVHWLDSLPA